MKNITLPPGGKVESHTVYEAVNVRDTSDRFKVIADSELHAKVELLDKLGYRVDTVSKESDSGFKLVDADTDEVKAILTAGTYELCIDEVLRAAKWKIQEPMEMIGGSMGGGFNEVTFDDE
jgi:hypothetical protein